MKSQEIRDVSEQFYILSDYAYSIGDSTLTDRYNAVAEWLELKAIKAEDREKRAIYNEYFRTHAYED